jgi:hypothetical protein
MRETACAGAIGQTAKGKAMDRIIEDESGTYTTRDSHPHDGYYAGDFSSVPFKQPDLRALIALTRGATRSAT